jgi:hypothetical protein
MRAFGMFSLVETIDLVIAGLDPAIPLRGAVPS